MEISTFDWENVWQVACGDTTRDYRNVFFFNFGLMLIACKDDEGPYDETQRPYDSKKWGSALRDIYPIAAEMEIGDTVIAKKGKAIVGVGSVSSDYYYDGYKDWTERFSEELKKSTIREPYVDIHFSKTRLDDVDGWDQRHTRYVDWYTGPEIKCKSLAITTARAHTGIDEATPAGDYVGQFFDHIGFNILDKWYVLSEFIENTAASTEGRMGDIRGLPSEAELVRIKDNAAMLADKL